MKLLATIEFTLQPVPQMILNRFNKPPGTWELIEAGNRVAWCATEDKGFEIINELTGGMATIKEI